MKYLSLFSGIGGFELGIKQAYENNQSIQQEPIGERAVGGGLRPSGSLPNTNCVWEDREKTRGVSSPVCIGFSEIDKYATQIYQKHFPNHKNYGDVTKIKELPDFDLLIGGFPCQAFSIAGKRGGFLDTRGTLFFEIARIVREKQPRLLLLENVKGLLSHDKGNTFYTIITTLDELGYDCQWQVLNSKNHGVPQNRERVFIIGHLRGTSRPQVFPFGGTGGANNQKLEGETTGTVKQGWGSYQNDATYIKVAGSLSSDKWDKFAESSRRVYDSSGISPTVPTSAGGGHIPKIAEMKEHLKAQGLEMTEKGEKAFVAMTEKRTEEAKKIRRETKDRDYSPRREKKLEKRTDGMGNCVTSGQSKEHFLTNDSKIRRLTPKECERLQGFPDGWTEGVSDTQRYKTLGNAVTVNVIKDIMEKLL